MQLFRERKDFFFKLNRCTGIDIYLILYSIHELDIYLYVTISAVFCPSMAFAADWLDIVIWRFQQCFALIWPSRLTER